MSHVLGGAKMVEASMARVWIAVVVIGVLVPVWGRGDVVVSTSLDKRVFRPGEALDIPVQ